MICENCIFWSQCEEECTIIDMLEYDEDQFYRVCPDTSAKVTNGDKCPIEKKNEESPERHSSSKEKQK